MLSSRKNNADGTSKQNRELNRLRRQDLLELLLDQMHESDDLRATIGQQQLRIAELEGLTERLKDKLDLKDEQIEHLKDKLNAKDEQIEHLKGKLNDKDELIERLKKRLDIKDIMIALYHHIDDAAKRYGKDGNYVDGANIAGFEKVVDAMISQGIV